MVYLLSSSVPKDFEVLGEDGVIIVFSPGHIFTFGDTNILPPTMLLGAFGSYFSSPEIQAIEDQKQGTELTGQNFILQYFTPSIARIIVDDSILWLLGDVTEEEIIHLKKQAVPLDSDFWVLSRGIGFLKTGIDAIPAQGIFYGGERNPSKKLTNFASKHQLPLISAKKTGGFRLTREEETWIVRVRE